VHGLRPLNPGWGLVIGDCVHNARSALDYLMVRLVAIKTGVEPRDVEDCSFPIYADPGRYKGAIAALQKDNLLLPGYRARIEQLQPFNAWDPSIWGAVGTPALLPETLNRLSVLDNVDKHRVLHATWHRAAEYSADSLPVFPPGFVHSASSISGEPLEDGTEIGRWYFEAPVPSNWEPMQVDMKRCFPVQVALNEPWLNNSVTEVLWHCLRGAATVLKIFEPVFSHGLPPLPVTTPPPDWPLQ